ncbi:MAG TPA: radical SAM protein [Gemmatimonadales bacterium]|nr:radical SAM protein [Gemmatimonadales bacterium]
MRRPAHACLGLSHLSALRVGAVWMIEQLSFLPSRRAPRLPVLDQRARGTRFQGIEVRSALNSPAATHMGFWSLNPYIGCEFGCAYCYARDTHRWTLERLGTDPAEPRSFERDILVKTNLVRAIIRTLDPVKLAGQTLAIGTATDPYQPAERRFRLTRLALEALLAYRDIKIGITTKSPLVARDIDLLTRLQQRHAVRVNMSLATVDARLARRLEARTAVPAARLRAVRRLADAGIRAGIFVMPVVPCITDRRSQLDALLAAAKQAGASFIAWSALRLGPAARRHFLPHLAREFPDLVARYQRHYGHGDNADRAYCRALDARFESLRRKYGFVTD